MQYKEPTHQPSNVSAPPNDSGEKSTRHQQLRHDIRGCLHVIHCGLMVLGAKIANEPELAELTTVLQQEERKANDLLNQFFAESQSEPLLTSCSERQNSAHG